MERYKGRTLKINRDIDFENDNETEDKLSYMHLKQIIYIIQRILLSSSNND